MKFAFAAAFLALSTIAGCGTGPADGKARIESAATVPLAIRSGTTTHKFRVEVARTPEEQARGMMFRPPLAPGRGMIFPLGAPRVASFWMKNCDHPLDMIFIRADGSIARIVTATPHNLIPEESGEPVVAVLEIAGGEAARLGIAEDDRVTYHDRES